MIVPQFLASEAVDNVVVVAFGRKTMDGGKARIQARRRLIFPQEGACDLSMREADTAPCKMNPAS